MTKLICFLISNILLTLPSVVASDLFSYQTWNRSMRQNFMAPIHLYAGVPLQKQTPIKAPPIETVSPPQRTVQWNNELWTTKTTFITRPFVSTTAKSRKRFPSRRRNRTRSTLPEYQVSTAPQKFGIVVAVYEPTESFPSIPSSSANPVWWYAATTTTKTPTFFDRFSKLPTPFPRPPPPTVPRSFTGSRVFSYYTTATTTTSTTTTTTTTTTSMSTHRIRRPTETFQRTWSFSVPSLSKIIDNYPKYSTILRWFQELSNHPNISRFFAYESVGQTHENRSIIVAKIGLMPFNTIRRSIWIDGGIHAREWISTATVLYTMARLINGTLARDPNVRTLIDTYDFYFMPVVNPDGYVYTHDDEEIRSNIQQDPEQRRMWRKNRRPHENCPGVDLNRNFPFAWDNRGASKFPCEETYRGPYPESEPEVRAITSFILKRRRHFHSFVTLHAFGNMWMLPFSFSTRIRPFDYHRIERLMQQINRYTANTYKIGQSSTVLYPATGTSEDWAKAIAQIPHTFSIELPPSTDAFDMRQNEMNGFTFYSNKEITTIAESNYRLIHSYLKHLARLPTSTRIRV